MFEFRFDLVGTGWAEATVGDGSRSTQISASYIGDALGDLLLAIFRLLDGAATPRCSWWEEPGEYCWLFSRDGAQVTLRIVEFQSLMGTKPDDAGLVLFETMEPLHLLGAEVSRASHAVLGQHGFDGYKDIWHEHDFPSAALASIDSVLASGRVTFTDAD